jgi:hypothetical protein
LILPSNRQPLEMARFRNLLGHLAQNSHIGIDAGSFRHRVPS